MKKSFIILFLFLNIVGCGQSLRDNLLRQDFVRGLPDSLRKKADLSWVNNQLDVITIWANNKFMTPDLLSGYATENWINQQGFMKQGYTPATTFITAQYANNTFVTPDLLSGYATENWVNAKNYTTLSLVKTAFNYDELIHEYGINITGNASNTELWVSQNYATKAMLDSVKYSQAGSVDTSKVATHWYVDTARINIWNKLSLKSEVGHNHPGYFQSQDTSGLHFLKFYARDTAISNRAYQTHGHPNYLQYPDTANLFYTKFNQRDTAIANRAFLNHTHTKTVRIPQTYTISGEIKVASGDTDFINSFFISLPSGQTARLVSCRYVINSGTNATVKLAKNGSDITGFTSISVTTTAASVTPTAVTLSDNDKISLVVSSVSGTPKNLSFTIFIEYSF